MLEENDDLTAQDMMDLQMDAVNLRAREFIPLFTDMMAVEDVTEAEKTALESLKKWNFSDDVSLAQPLIFDRWLANIEAILYEDIPEEMLELFSAQGQTTDELLRLGNDSIWVSEHGGMEKLLHDSFTTTINGLEKTYGTNQATWQWGKFHQVQFKHPLSSASKALGYIFNKEEPIPVNGSNVTPMAASHDGTGLVDHGASWRFVIDMEESLSGYHIVGPGQSGHLKSPWYSDQTEDWVNETYHKTNLSNDKGKVLKLVPEK